jgi:hypothetical protein
MLQYNDWIKKYGCPVSRTSALGKESLKSQTAFRFFLHCGEAQYSGLLHPRESACEDS